ncbi:MAG: hypothetical protein KDD51_12720 [Bdellovibrionales bacterium]|nr:hypothetical protein [Bdellovibrionales bacterium]
MSKLVLFLALFAFSTSPTFADEHAPRAVENPGNEKADEWILNRVELNDKLIEHFPSSPVRSPEFSKLVQIHREAGFYREAEKKDPAYVGDAIRSAITTFLSSPDITPSEFRNFFEDPKVQSILGVGEDNKELQEILKNEYYRPRNGLTNSLLSPLFRKSVIGADQFEKLLGLGGANGGVVNADFDSRFRALLNDPRMDKAELSLLHSNAELIFALGLSPKQVARIRDVLAR